jgi:hypothetical protein
VAAVFWLLAISTRQGFDRPSLIGICNPVELDPFARQPLANHIELFERGIVERDAAVLVAVADFGFQSRQIGELAFEQSNIGICFT